jgi:uncharacterized protein with von Willebrand factor type A (vWA) domain
VPEPPAPGARSFPRPPPQASARFTEALVGFAREVRAAGLTVGTGDVVTYVEAAATLSPSDLLDLYWAGRVTLVTRRDDIPAYDRVFRSYFLAEDSPASEPLGLTATARAQASAALVVPAAEPGVDEGRDQQQLGLMASDVAALKHRSFASCNPDELAALRRIMRTIKLTPPRRRTRRTRAASSGTIPDLRNTIRNETRLIACPAPVLYRQRKTRLRPLILVLDVSGSMADYSRHLLQFAHTARHAAAKVEVFCFGTRLTRITRQLRARNIDLALERAGESVRDWESGTRIGESLDELIRRWGRAGMCRGAVVVICSDGLDRGDPELLAASMERLARLAYRVVWLNPHKGDNRDFRPSTVGMMVAAPHIDLLLSGHDLASLEELAALLPVLN